MTNNKYTPEVGHIVLAKSAQTGGIWHNFIVTFYNDKTEYIGLESLGRSDDYEGLYKESGIEIRKAPNQNEEPETEMYLGR